jgi:hypothetical protein
MRFAEINELLLISLREASKVLHMDASHAAMREKIQSQLAADHRAKNPESDYYGYPSVRDTYGDAESGVVVHATKGKYTASKYKKDGEDYKLSDHKAVKPAYVMVKNDAEEQKESSTVILIDGLETETLAAKESATTCEEVVELREACFDAAGVGTVKLIAPGHGATGYYSPEVLKEATTKGVFDNAQMFIDHATEDEEAARPEGSVKGLAAKGGKATYQEAGPEGPGVYTSAKAYPDTAPFLNARAKDIGVSIRAVGRAVVGQVGGKVNRIVKSLDGLKSADFVTKAGAGGKLVTLLESFRASGSPNTQRQQAAPTKENDVAKIEIEETELTALKESAAKIPTLQLSIDRSNERFNRIEAKSQAADYLKESGLPVPAQTRLLKMVASPQFALPVAEGVLDVTKFTESLKVLVTEEAAYLKESGSGFKLVSGMGDPNVKPTDEETKFAEAQKTADAEFDTLVGGLSGVPRKEKK